MGKSGKSPSSDREPNRQYPQADLKVLYGLSAGLCAYPACFQPCIKGGADVIDKVMVGQIGHIEGVGEKGPRHNPELTIKQRDCYDNWILLCNLHHPVIDERDGDGKTKYPVDVLRQWKTDIESFVAKRLQKTMPTVTTAELAIVTKYVLRAPSNPNADFTLVDPARKLKKNGLSSVVEEQLRVGLGKSKEVEKFVANSSVIDPDFADSLKAGFVAKYDELWADDLRGDAIFFALKTYACNGSNSALEEAAALAVLAYLFERCEVFEKSFCQISIYLDLNRWLALALFLFKSSVKNR